MKKVLIVASVVSFIEWFNQKNVEHLHWDLGCEVHVACNCDYMDDTDEERTLQYLDRLRSEGIVLHNIPFARNPLSPRNLTAYRLLRSLIRSENFDLIHCHTPAASMLTRLAARRERKKGTVVMYSCHGFHFHNDSPRKNWLIYYPVEKFLSRFCDYLVTINQEDYQRAKTFHCKQVRYIPGVGVDVQKFRAASTERAAIRREIGVGDDQTLVLSVGELIERKNHEVILRALGRLNDPNIFFAVAGKGPLRERLLQIAEEEGVADRFRLLGFRKDTADLYHAADICAFPSRIEGLGLSGVEALAAGIPLVSSNIHGILDYSKDGITGYTASPDDADGFARAIKTLADHPELRAQMRENCCQAAEPFDISNALHAMWGVYQEIL